MAATATATAKKSNLLAKWLKGSLQRREVCALNDHFEPSIQKNNVEANLLSKLCRSQFLRSECILDFG